MNLPNVRGLPGPRGTAAQAKLLESPQSSPTLGQQTENLSAFQAFSQPTPFQMRRELRVHPPSCQVGQLSRILGHWEELVGKGCLWVTGPRMRQK